MNTEITSDQVAEWMLKQARELSTQTGYASLSLNCIHMTNYPVAPRWSIYLGDHTHILDKLSYGEVLQELIKREKEQIQQLIEKDQPTNTTEQ
jgi:hypothetical protein